MSSLKTTSTLSESDYEMLVTKYMRENNLGIINHVQIAAKLMDIENAIRAIKPHYEYTV